MQICSLLSAVVKLLGQESCLKSTPKVRFFRFCNADPDCLEYFLKRYYLFFLVLLHVQFLLLLLAGFSLLLLVSKVQQLHFNAVINEIILLYLTIQVQ